MTHESEQQQPESAIHDVASRMRLPRLQPTKRLFLIGFFGFLGVVIVLSLGIGIYRVYAKAAQDRFSVAVASVLRLPAAKVNGVTISYSDYADDLRAITVMRDYDKANNGPAANLTAEQLSDQVLFRQVNNILVGELATKFGVTVDDKDIEAVKTDILQKEFQSLANAEKAIRDRYGWDLGTFEKKVIRPFVLQNKLSEKIKNDTVAREKVRVEAQSVLDQVKAGGNFAALAEQYGQDGTASKGGELGWFGKGEMVPEFEKAVFALQKNEIAASLVESPFGYHIVQLEDRKTEKVKDDKGKAVDKTTVKARHILFMYPTIDKQLNEDVKAASIHIYPKVHNPFLTLQNSK